jgi:hypothetical protein
MADKNSKKRELPPLFWYMESQDWDKATERVRKHPREVKTWATLRTKSEADAKSSKRLALHHACFKLRSAGSAAPTVKPSDDPFIQTCRFILLLIRLYPDAASQRESRHGCLPLHLAAFASCAPRTAAEQEAEEQSGSSLGRPGVISRRIASDATTGTDMSAIHAEEDYAGGMKDKQTRLNIENPNVSVAMTSNIIIHPKREEMAVQVLNALLDAYPKGIRVDSEGGRLPLHTAVAGRATPRVLSTLVTAYPSAARHRNKDGFLPLHLAAHWGVSHPNVAISLLKAYPDATLGRNRWERTPLEEALCMAGENGRPHQGPLVRALRKHPTYWTRPSSEVLRIGRGRVGPVDVDESLPSNESDTVEEERRFLQFGHAGISEVGERVDEQPQRVWLNNDQDNLMLGVDLATLIQDRRWRTVLARLSANPLEAEQDLKVLTRGGFTAVSGMTPLHYACERRPPVEVVNALIESFPTAVLTRTMPGGNLPIHVACTWYGSPDIVTALLTADQGGARVADELGNLALHSACFSGAEDAAIVALLETYPKGVVARNNQGSRPIDICRRLRHFNRRNVMSLLTAKKDEITHQHKRNPSSGTWSEVASQAIELNER